MLTGQDLNKEIKLLDLLTDGKKDVSEKVYLRAEVKALTLILKMLQSMRTNQVIGLKKAGAVLVKPRTKEIKKDK